MQKIEIKLESPAYGLLIALLAAVVWLVILQMVTMKHELKHDRAHRVMECLQMVSEIAPRELQEGSSDDLFEVANGWCDRFLDRGGRRHE